MAYLTGPNPVVGSTTDVHDTARNAVGTIAKDASFNEYIYLKGCASTIVGSWVVFPSSTFVSVLLVTGATAIGKVAVAQAAVGATSWGWYQIYGLATGSVATGAAGAAVWTTATPGRVDNTDQAVEIISGARQVSATASNLATFDLNYPFCSHMVND